MVHPRTRGEHAPAFCSENARIGSSPHARGTRPLLARDALKIRFIPARAGNTLTANTRPTNGLLALPKAHRRGVGSLAVLNVLQRGQELHQRQTIEVLGLPTIEARRLK